MYLCFQSHKRSRYLFLNIDLQVVFYHVHQGIFAAGIQHPLSDATLVPGHRIDEDCREKSKERMSDQRGSAADDRRSWRLTESVHLWTPSSRLHVNVCKGRSGIVQTLWGFSSAGLSALSARCCTTGSAPVRRLLALDRGNKTLILTAGAGRALL